MRRAAKVDYTQDSIVKALRSVGVQVEVIGKPLDLLLAVRNPKGDVRTLLMECKSPGGRFTKDQAEFMAHWIGEIVVAHNATDAVTAALGKEVMG